MKTPPIKELVKSTFRAWLSIFVFSPAALMFIGIMYFGNFSAVGASEILASLDGKIIELWFFLGWVIFAIKLAILFIQHGAVDGKNQAEIDQSSTPT